MSKPTDITRKQMVEIREWLDGEKFIVAHDAFRKKHNKRIDAILAALEEPKKPDGNWVYCENCKKRIYVELPKAALEPVTEEEGKKG